MPEGIGPLPIQQIPVREKHAMINACFSPRITYRNISLDLFVWKCHVTHQPIGALHYSRAATWLLCYPNGAAMRNKKRLQSAELRR